MAVMPLDCVLVVHLVVGNDVSNHRMFEQLSGYVPANHRATERKAQGEKVLSDGHVGLSGNIYTHGMRSMCSHAFLAIYFWDFICLKSICFRCDEKYFKKMSGGISAVTPAQVHWASRETCEGKRYIWRSVFVFSEPLTEATRRAVLPRRFSVFFSHNSGRIFPRRWPALYIWLCPHIYHDI